MRTEFSGNREIKDNQSDDLDKIANGPAVTVLSKSDEQGGAGGRMQTVPSQRKQFNQLDVDIDMMDQAHIERDDTRHAESNADHNFALCFVERPRKER